MSSYDTGFFATSGFRAIEIDTYQWNKDEKKYIETTVTDRGATVLYSVKQILSYIPIISTIVGIFNLVLFLSNGNPSTSEKVGLILRSVAEILYFVPYIFAVDTIANVGRLVESAN